MTGGLKHRDATLSLADRQELDQKIQGRGVGGMEDVLLEGGR